MIKIVTDSTCDLSKEKLKELDIQVVPLSIQANGETYLDGVDLSPEEFVDLLAISTDLPKSSQPSVGSFQQMYDRLEEENPGVQILSIHMTSKMSGTYQSAELASKESKADVVVIDSEYISGALAFQVEEAANMVKEGRSIGAIITRIQEIRDQSHLYLMLDTLEYLKKGGRIGKGKALLGSLLKVKPLAFLEEGQLSPIKNMRTHKQVIDYLVDGFSKAVHGKTIKKVSISHIEADGLAARLLESLRQAAGDFPCVINVTSPIISTHTGPGAIALMYYAE